MLHVTRWDPFRELTGLRERMNRLFSDTQYRWADDEPVGAWVPPVDIFENGEELVVRAELPGVSRDDIEVSVQNGTLVLKGERKWDEKVTEENAFRIERRYGSFMRSFTLPTQVNDAKIKAVYRDGVLEVSLPKADEAKPKRIAVSNGN